MSEVEVASPRAQLQARIATWLVDRAHVFSAPYGVIMGERVTIRHGKARTITFGIARTLDADLTIWSDKLLTLRTSRGDDHAFSSEAEFYGYAAQQYGARQ